MEIDCEQGEAGARPGPAEAQALLSHSHMQHCSEDRSVLLNKSRVLSRPTKLDLKFEYTIMELWNKMKIVNAA